MKDEWEVYEKKDIINDLFDDKTNKIEDEFEVSIRDSIDQKDEQYRLLNKSFLHNIISFSLLINVYRSSFVSFSYLKSLIKTSKTSSILFSLSSKK